VLQRRTVDQELRVGSDRDLAGVQIQLGARSAARNRIADLPGQRDGPDPFGRVRKIAEALAEKYRRGDRAEPLGADLRGAGPAPFDHDPGRHGELVLRVAQELIFEAGLEILETAGVGTPGRPEMRPGFADGDPEVLGDALGDLAGDVDLPRRRVVAV